MEKRMGTNKRPQLLTFFLIFIPFSTYYFLFTVLPARAQLFTITAGADTTAVPVELTGAEIGKLSASDDQRLGSNTNWPNSGVYDLNKYLEFRWLPKLAPTASVQKVNLIHEYRRYGAMEGAKLLVSGGGVNKEYPLTTKGADGNDVTDTIDLTADFNTPAQLNSLVARFTAYRNPGSTATAQTKTSHDYVALDITWSGDVVAVNPLPTSTPTASPTPALTPTSTSTARPTISATAKATLAPTSTPVPTISLSPTPTVTPPTAPSAQPTILVASAAPLATVVPPTKTSASTRQLSAGKVDEANDWHSYLGQSAQIASVASSSSWFTRARQLGLVLLVAAAGVFGYFIIRPRQ